MSSRRWRASPLVQLTLVRLREYTREPEALFWVFVFPVLVVLALGVAFRSPARPPVYVGVEPGPGAEAVRAALGAAGGFQCRVVAPDRTEAALRDGEVQVVVVPGDPPAYRYDPTRPESRLARLAVDDTLQRARGRRDVWRAADVEVVTPGARYIDWLVPGLLGMNLVSTSLWGVAFSIVQTRTRKLLKRLVATPMRRRDFLLAQLLGRLIFLAPEVVVLLAFARWVFGVRINGSLVLVGALCLLGSVASAGLALLVSARARTVEAVSGWLNVVMLPMWVLSGVFFSSSHFPAAMQPFIQALPLTALNDALRAVMLEGAGPGAVLGEAGILFAWTVGAFALALRWFRWL